MSVGYRCRWIQYHPVLSSTSISGSDKTLPIGKVARFKIKIGWTRLAIRPGKKAEKNYNTNYKPGHSQRVFIGY
jgi:hypothetical protein